MARGTTDYVETSDSDHDGAESGPRSTPGEDASMDEIREALKQEQLRNQKLVQSNKKLKEIKGDDSASQKKPKKPKSDGSIPAELIPHADQITRLGKKCTVMLCLWIPDEVFRKKRPLVDHTDVVRRYANPRNQELALIDELYAFVPEEYHTYLLGLPKFGDIFKTGNGSCRSSVLYNVRSKAAVIFKLDEKYFSGEHSVKDCVEILDLLGYDENRKVKFDPFPPILCPDNVKNMRKIFRNPALPLILRIAFHGAGALNSVGKGKPKVKAQLWNVTSVNESSIAFAAVMARFVLSKDTEFQVKGAVTGIKYEQDFWVYRKILGKADAVARQDLIDFYNDIVFPNHSQAPAKSKDNGDDDEEDLADAIAAFNLGPDSDETPVGNNSSEDGTDYVDTPTTEIGGPAMPARLSPSPSADISPSTAPHATSEPRHPTQANPDLPGDEHPHGSGEDNDEMPISPAGDYVLEEEAPDIIKTVPRKKIRAPNAAVGGETSSRPTLTRLRRGTAKETETNDEIESGTEKERKGKKSKSAKPNLKGVVGEKPVLKPRKSIVLSDEEGEI